MPELPEVETIVRQVGEVITGWRVARARVLRKDVVHGDPRPLGRVLIGLRVAEVRRRAKRVILDLGAGDEHDPVRLVFHLGMSGQLLLHDVSEKCETHTHIRIGFADERVELRFRDPRRLGGVWCLTGNPKYRGKVLGALGEEPLTMRVAAFRTILGRKRQIKALLLDQAAIAGIGNIYCDEALFDAGIHPTTIAMRIDDAMCRVLLSSIKKTLRKAIEHNGSTLKDYRSADGEAGSFQQMHRVYGREGGECCRCGGLIERMTVAGRSSFICGGCQIVF